jgi:cytochrome c oxidase subunit 2
MTPVLLHLTLAFPLLPDQASVFRVQSDALFWFVTGIGVFFFCLITVLLFYFVIRYRQRPGHTAQPSPTHNLPLEIIWSAIPTAIVIVIFVLGYKGFLFSQTTPANFYEIEVQGQRWSWGFKYPNGYRSDTLHVPVNRPVKLTLTSMDVIHSLFIPAFGVKRDVVPGRSNTTWLQATKTGEFDIYCSEYCGQGHSTMLSKVVVHAPGTFEPWLAEASRNALDELANVKPDGSQMLAFWRQNPDITALLQKYPELKDKDFLKKLQPMWVQGQKLYDQRCATCHEAGTCPSYRGLWKRGTERVTIPGKARVITVKVDEDYLRESILEPSAKIVEGFDDRMTSFKGQLNETEIQSLIEFIKKYDEVGAKPK